jgi:NADPH-dependent 2,4-dienoyl-CoA reductase/sulfur reductase-like enzyme
MAARRGTLARGGSCLVVLPFERRRGDGGRRRRRRVGSLTRGRSAVAGRHLHETMTGGAQWEWSYIGGCCAAVKGRVQQILEAPFRHGRVSHSGRNVLPRLVIARLVAASYSSVLSHKIWQKRKKSIRRLIRD